jgi:hypothetical protein
MGGTRRITAARVRLAGAVGGVAVALLVSLSSVARAGAEEVTHVYGPTGSERSLVVPEGVTTIRVHARGGRGAGGAAAAEVAGSLAVSGSEKLYVEVGGNGSERAGGFNGGGEGGAGGGGGAPGQGGGGGTDIRTSPRSAGLSPDTRVLVAGAGGGGGSSGAGGGAAGKAGAGIGGEPGTQTGGGEGGWVEECFLFEGRPGQEFFGSPGRLGIGGDGAACLSKGHGSAGGGGGGGGYYGGGGGDAAYNFNNHRETGGGGGGGSSLVPAGGTLALAGATSEPVAELSFTAIGSPPTAVTEAASAVTHAGATLDAAVNPNGHGVSECAFEYGTTNSYGSSAPCTATPGSGTSQVPVSATIGSLSGNTTYHYRVVAANSGGTSYGSDETLKTQPNPPTVVTNGLSALTTTSATLTGEVNPNGGEVSECEFEYGTTPSYGSSVGCSPPPGSGTALVRVSGAIGGLSEATLYHFRVVAHNVSGTTYGRDLTFMTRAVPAPPEWGRCVVVGAGSGGYSSSACTAAQSGGSYEWLPAIAPQPLVNQGFTLALRPTTKFLLEVKGGEKIVCTGQTGAGEYAGRRALVNVSLKLTGCYLNSEADHCENTLTAGEIESEALTGTLGVLKEESEAVKDKVGLLFAPASGEVLAEFTCESVAVTVRGSVILQGKGNVMLSKTTLKAALANGTQKWTHFAGGHANEDVLEVKIGANSFMQAGLVLATVQTNTFQAKVEANTVF